MKLEDFKLNINHEKRRKAFFDSRQKEANSFKPAIDIEKKEVMKGKGLDPDFVASPLLLHEMETQTITDHVMNNGQPTIDWVKDYVDKQILTRYEKEVDQNPALIFNASFPINYTDPVEVTWYLNEWHTGKSKTDEDKNPKIRDIIDGYVENNLRATGVTIPDGCVIGLRVTSGRHEATLITDVGRTGEFTDTITVSAHWKVNSSEDYWELNIEDPILYYLINYSKTFKLNPEGAFIIDFVELGDVEATVPMSEVYEITKWMARLLYCSGFIQQWKEKHTVSSLPGTKFAFGYHSSTSNHLGITNVISGEVTLYSFGAWANIFNFSMVAFLQDTIRAKCSFADYCLGKSKAWTRPKEFVLSNHKYHTHQLPKTTDLVSGWMHCKHEGDGQYRIHKYEQTNYDFWVHQKLDALMNLVHFTMDSKDPDLHAMYTITKTTAGSVYLIINWKPYNYEKILIRTTTIGFSFQQYSLDILYHVESAELRLENGFEEIILLHGDANLLLNEKYGTTVITGSKNEAAEKILESLVVDGLVLSLDEVFKDDVFKEYATLVQSGSKDLSLSYLFSLLCSVDLFWFFQQFFRVSESSRYFIQKRALAGVSRKCRLQFCREENDPSPRLVPSRGSRLSKRASFRSGKEKAKITFDTPEYVAGFYAFGTSSTSRISFNFPAGKECCFHSDLAVQVLSPRLFPTAPTRAIKLTDYKLFENNKHIREPVAAMWTRRFDRWQAADVQRRRASC